MELPKRFSTVRDVLDFVESLHSALSEQYAELEQLASSERAQLMLDYLNRHEQHLAQTLAQYEDDVSTRIAGLWLQEVPSLQASPLLEKLRAIDLNDVEAIVATALEIDGLLLELYRDLAREAESDEAREVLNNLLKMEDNERHRIARSAFRLADI